VHKDSQVIGVFLHLWDLHAQKLLVKRLLNRPQVYMFRVLAVNAQGEGEPLESSIPVIAKHALDPPVMPATPRVVDFDRKSAKLEWWAPSDNNIKHYIIEMQERFLVPKDSVKS